MAEARQSIAPGSRSSGPLLALGTAQFGLAYGIDGRSERISDEEARKILTMAHRRGVRMLDTAPAYGEIDERLVGLFPEGAEFRVTTKIPALPARFLEPVPDEAGACAHVRTAIDRAVARLGRHVSTVLFHHSKDLQRSIGSAIWHTARSRALANGLCIGVSLYDLGELPDCCSDTGLDVIQCPANVFDQRVLTMPSACDLAREIHVRSVFLQGLLTMDVRAAARRLPAAETALRLWQEWCGRYSLSAVTAALSFAKSLPVKYCVIGVDSAAQFTEVADAWEVAVPRRMPELAINDTQIVDPRAWVLAE
jgi:aryl-alcohol dehydrogenase-like predicted oxidoreductase